MARYDLDDDIFERQAGIDRLAQLREARAHFERHEQADREAAALRKAKAEAASRRWNERILRNEYAAAAVAPPWTNGDGVPTVSLSLLRQIGWTVESYSGQNTLVAPAAAHAKGKA